MKPSTWKAAYCMVADDMTNRGLISKIYKQLNIENKETT